MRITNEEIAAITSILSQYIHSNAELKLFGSRADVNTKGGDIDLLLIIESHEEKLKIIARKSEMLADIKEKIGDQKIDLLIRSKKEIETDYFVQTILQGSVCLKRWI